MPLVALLALSTNPKVSLMVASCVHLARAAVLCVVLSQGATLAALYLLRCLETLRGTRWIGCLCYRVTLLLRDDSLLEAQDSNQ